jgi:maltooligosyltrehalose trehalohydrolase
MTDSEFEFPLGMHWRDDGLSVSTWASKCKSVSVELQRGSQWHSFPLSRQDDGYYHALLDWANIDPNCGDSICRDSEYRFVLNGELRRPDPVSRLQPHGVHGPSQLVDDRQFPWTDAPWQGVSKRDLVIYELHIGAFSRGGTFRSAIERLDSLVELGVTAIELLPVAQSAGRWNWGYDGVQIYAVRETFGGPDELRALVDACHARGLAVIMDVVYNHLGPEGNYLGDFGHYFSRRHRTPWGEAFNFDGKHAQHVRRFVIENALYWLRDYHLDGLRLDAVHFMFDESESPILDDIRGAVAEYDRSVAREIHLIAEANIFDDDLLSHGKSAPYDAIWCDDLMHSIYSTEVSDVQLTPRTYDGLGDVAEALNHGYLYRIPQASRVPSVERPRFTPPHDTEYLNSLVTALQTHDSVGNHPHGKRLHELTSPPFQAAAAALMLLYPTIPLMFMGEETATDARFPFFADFEDPDLRRAVDRGRRHEYPDHQWDGAVLPSDPRAFHDANLEGAAHDETMRQWYRTLLGIRRVWRQSDILTPGSLRVDWSADWGYCRLNYQEAWFVVVRLVPGQQLSPLTFRWVGHLLLDSQQATAGTIHDLNGEPHDCQVELQYPQAIVGRVQKNSEIKT